MTLQACNYSRQVAQYAACSLVDSEAESFDSHLQECSVCRQALASVIEGGVGPEWLGWCRSTIDDELSLSQAVTDKQAATDDAEGADSSGLGSQRYRRVRRIGNGGMGVVWEGWDTVMRRKVALKELRSAEESLHVVSTRQSRRLIQEASSLARLSHPNIVSVFEVFMTHERPTMVMEFVDGPTLSQWCGDQVVAERQAAMLVETLALAAHHAHENGVVHRDLKPSNVLLSFPRDQSDLHANLSLATPKLSDFGLARTNEDPSLTQAGDLIGTPAFMAPEQAFGDATLIGPATDVYGLGATLYGLLTGTVPHVAEDPVATLDLVRHRDPIGPRMLRPELSKDIETICMKCLRRTPADRYPSAAALAADLRAYLEGRAILARPQSRFAIAARWCRRHKLLASALSIAFASVVALVIGAIVFAKTQHALRTKADESADVAREAKGKALQEAERAEAATQQIQEQFRVTIGAVDNIAYLLNAASVEPNGFPMDVLQQLRGNAIALYDGFLKSLPEHEKWTFRDAQVALRHAELIVQHSPDRLTEGRERVAALTPVVKRLERESPSSPETCTTRDWHLRTAATFAELAGDHDAAARYSIERAEHLKAWSKLAPENIALVHDYRITLHYASVHSLSGGKREEALRFVKQSAEVARQLVEKSDGAESDRVTYMHELAWTANCAQTLDDKEELRVVRGKVRELRKTFDESSPRFGEVDSLAAYVEQVCQGLSDPLSDNR